MTGVGPLAAEKFWILDPLYESLGALLTWFYALIPSYGVAIVLLTLAVRIITIPLTAKQARAQQKMQQLAPELKRLQAKYKHDKQKLNEEVMKFYKEHNANPFGGCLPILIQAPVLLVLYRLILDLNAKPDPKHISESTALFRDLKESGGSMVSWGMDLAESAANVSGKFPYLLLIALVVGTGYFQQKQLTRRISKENINPQMAMMTKIFPAMFGFISYTVPAGVVVYFLVSNIWQIGQQAFLFRNQPSAEPAKDDKTGAAKGGKGGKTGAAKGGAGAKPATTKGKAAAAPTGKGKTGAAKGEPSKGGAGKRGKPLPAGAKGSGKSGATGKRPGGPPSTKGAGGRGPAKGGPPAGTKAKGSGKGAPGSRPSGRVTPPKRAQAPTKGKPAAKGVAAGKPGRPGGRADAVESQPKWWERLLGAGSEAESEPEAPEATPTATDGDRARSVGDRAWPAKGKAKAKRPAPKGPPPGGAPEEPVGATNGRAKTSSGDGPPVTDSSRPTNGSGEDRAESGATPPPVTPAPKNDGERADGEQAGGDPESRTAGDIQRGDP